MLTKHGIEWNLFQSKYIYKYNDLEFYFSSKFYLEKFKEELQNYIDMEAKKFYNRFKVKINLERIFAISLYKKIEKRGCLIYYIDKSINGNEKIQITEDYFFTTILV